MKRIKRMLALILALALVISCVGTTAFAAETGETSEGRTSGAISSLSSERFKEGTAYQYTDDETVRTIVVLDGTPTADGTAKAVLDNEHDAVKAELENLGASVKFEFETLIDAISCDVAYGKLTEIAGISGVKKVYLANEYTAPKNVASSGWTNDAFTNNDISQNSYNATGEGMVIAVIDTGINLEHEAFQTAPTTPKLTSENMPSGYSYKTLKIPFAYNYADADDPNSLGVLAEHGTQVAAAAAGKTESGTYEGVAPEAQILAMKVFSGKGDQTTTTSDVYFAALEDAYTLGADVIELSLGSAIGYSYDSELEDEIYGEIYKRLQGAGIVVCTSAGDDDSMAEYSIAKTGDGTGVVGPEYTDYGTISSPASYAGNISVGSVENVWNDSFITDDSDDSDDSEQDALVKVTENTQSGEMSASSSWGTTANLTISPTMSSIGGNVYTANSGGNSEYTYQSGTSMATAQMAGTFANVLSYLRGTKNLSKTTAAKLAAALLESTADLMFDDGAYYSVRKQGSGLAMTENALDAYVNGAYISNPLKELGDDDSKSGTFSFTVTLSNNTGNAITYTPSAVVMTDSLAQMQLSQSEKISYYNSVNTASETMDLLENATVSYSSDTVTVGAGKSLDVTVSIDVTGDKTTLEQFTNGAFVEGFVTFEADGKQAIHATYLGYYGDWTKASILERADFIDYMEADDWLNTSIDGKYSINAGLDAYDILAGNAVTNNYTGDTSPIYTSYNFAALGDYRANLTIVPGDNLLDYVYGGGETKEYNAKYDSSRIALSTGAIGENSYTYADTLWMVPYQLRKAKTLTMTVKDADTDTVYYTTTEEYSPKTVYDDVANTWLSYSQFSYDGTDTSGNPLPNNTKVKVQFDAVLPYGDTKQTDCWSFNATIDNEAPTVQTQYDADTETLTVTASDNQYLAGIYLCDEAGDILAKYVYNDKKTNVKHTETIDIAALRDEYWWLAYTGDILDDVYVCAIDYATNETAVKTPLFETGNPATLTLVYYDGDEKVTEEIEMTTGDSYTLPIPENTPDGAEFFFWNSISIDDAMDPDAYDIYNYVSDPYTLNAGFSLLIMEDTTLYAVYKVGDVETLNPPRYSYFQQDDYSGEWAIVGLPYSTSAGDWLYTSPYVLQETTTKLLTSLDKNADLTNINQGEDYAIELGVNSGSEFDTSAENIRFTFTKMADGTYTIQTQSGKYLANQGALVADTKDDLNGLTTRWIVKTNDRYGNGEGTLIISAAGNKELLTFDDNRKSITLIDQTAQVKDYNGINTCNAIDRFVLRLYAYSDSEMNAKCYISDPTYTTTQTASNGGGSSGGGTGGAAGGGGSAGGGGAAGGGAAVEEQSADDETETEAETETETENDSFDSFSDCTGEWYREAVNYMVGNGLMDGTSDSKFSPTVDLNRAMAVTVLWRSVGKPTPNNTVGFTDVADGRWYTDAIHWAAENNVVNGVTTELFKPTNVATREQIVAILWRAAGKPTGTGDLSKFTDADEISNYAKTAMQWAVGEGILVGNNGKLRPTATASRAEFAVMFTRYASAQSDESANN